MSARSRRVALGPLTVVAVLILGLAACGGTQSAGPGLGVADPTAVPDHDFVIPTGTGARLDAGESLEIIPAQLEVRVGEVLRIVNADDRGHVIGPFYVGAGETLHQRFASPGTLQGECTVHPSGSFQLTVSP